MKYFYLQYQFYFKNISKAYEKKIKINKIFIFSFIAFFIINPLLSKQEQRSVLLFAPVSLSEVINEVLFSYKKKRKEIIVKPVFMGTSQLVMQIKNGANPDLFISANEDWMNYLGEKNFIIKKSKKAFVYNSLVVITNKKNKIEKINNIYELKKLFINSKSKISIAMTNSIPAGIYAKNYLENIGAWNNISNKYVESINVRAALNFVARNDLDYGIVYVTDAIANQKVKILYHIEKDKHEKIIYPIAFLNNKPETLDLYDFLLSKESLLKISKLGFKLPND
ncbi:MAG: molybdate ABC transporter substrate-binding protein [Pelagibacterales bacterium]|nr:molybdate ABC transporter substrate-binding protein [Pelagibacterales bacterium]OUU61788.1 MAG: molybdate ABC transporter substrate-binding protein [Alphaproteobacteria bacterium TMED62]|tara:strand:- start:508 stop:1350 length:843 start_codon:yes stop_codon:yes gene_type:complete